MHSYSSLFFLILAGLVLGTIYPDTDEPGSRIFKMKQDNTRIGWQRTYKAWREIKRTRDLKNMILFFYSSVLIVFGYAFRFSIYKPSVKVSSLINKNYVKGYEVKDKHRGISHSLFGIFIASVIILFFITLLNMRFKFMELTSLLVATISFSLGATFHLFQDSICTAGIRWFSPFKDTCIVGDYDFSYEDNTLKIFNFGLIMMLVAGYFLTSHILKINNGFFSLHRTNGLVLLTIIPVLSVFLVFCLLFKRYKVTILKQ